MSPQLPQLRKGGAEALDKNLREAVGRKEVPAVFFLATNAKETIYINQEGERILGDASAGKVGPDTILELFSQTKLITCLAALQLVDRGLVSLDSEADVEKHLPELASLPLLKGYKDDGKPILEKPKNKITLRMLMSHTAGFVYSHMETPLSAYLKQNPEDLDIFHPTASIKTILKPLVYEPGTAWLYSTSIDFVGKLVERVSGLRLDEYFQQHIFDPLGLKSLTFFPQPEFKQTKMSVCVRKPDGSLAVTPTGYGSSRSNEASGVSKDLLLGGAGLFGTLADYLAILRAILQADPSSPHLSSEPLISAESYRELFTGSIKTEKGKQGIYEMVNRPQYFEPPATPENVDHSVGFMINLQDFVGRRKKGSGSWSGAAKTNFWVDPTTGIAGIAGTQLFAPAPDPWFAVYSGFEKELYAQLD